MLLRETLAAVLATPGSAAAPTPELTRLFSPSWKGSTSGHALVLTGVRRCGKSTLQGQIQRRFKGTAVTINMEDTRLYGLLPEDFSTLISVLDTDHPKSAIYLDEVQEAPEWQRLVRALLDSGRQVCLTGSNASLLGREMGSKLTGRYIAHEVYPFSFREFISFTRRKASATSLEEYLLRGGFASALLHNHDDGSMLLRTLLRDVVHRDIVTRHSLRTARPLMTLALHLLAHTGQPLSLQALSKGLSLPSVAQTGRMVEYLQDAWLLLSVPRFSSSFKQRVTSPPKYYAIDTGLSAANTPNPTPDTGRRLENAVLLALRRTGATPTFALAPNEWECDFVTPHLAIQCCAKLTPENRSRELRGLIKSAGLPGSARKSGRDLLVITIDQEDVLEEDGHQIRVIPAWQWLD